MTGRKPLHIGAVDIIDATLDQPKIDGAMAQMRADGQELAVQAAAASALATQLGYEGALTVGALEDGIRFYQQRTAEACLELGKRLVLLKEVTAHGQFQPRLELLGIEYGAAKRFMAVASKFSKGPTSALLKAANNQSKLIELLVLDAGQFEEFELTGQSGDITLDQIAAMSVKELRAALKEAKAEKVAHDKLVANLHANNDKLKLELHRVEILPPDEQLAELHKSVADLMLKASGFITGHFRQGCVALAEHHLAHGGDSREVMAGHVAKLQKDLNELRDRFMLPNPVGDGTPAWKQWAAQQAADDATKA